jgi:UDP-glucuronate 4-epimerase
MDFIETIEKVVGKKAKKKLMPMQPGDVPSTYADTTALERDFGYKPKVSVEEGVAKFVEWYRNYYGV